MPIAVDLSGCSCASPRAGWCPCGTPCCLEVVGSVSCCVFGRGGERGCGAAWRASWAQAGLPRSLYEGGQPYISPALLLALRALMLVWIVVVWVMVWVAKPKNPDLESFTMQNYFLLFVYFALATVRSARAVRAGGTAGMLLGSALVPAAKAEEEESSVLDKLTLCLFEVELVNTQFVVLVFWALLWPLLSAGDDPGGEESPGDTIAGGFLNLSVHGLNMVFMLVDLFAGKLTLLPLHMWHGFVYAWLYLAWHFVWHALTGVWIYPILDTDLEVNPAAPVFYVAIPGMWLLLFALNVRLAKLARGSDEQQCKLCLCV